ncbi:MAG: aminoacyl-tRNA hydrolase [Lachnospiraceae bacterium]
MLLIAGLGNPTKTYEKTRHNVGFDTIDLLSETYKIPIKEKKFKGLIGTGMVGGEKVILLKPQTYMNLSGESVQAAMHYYNIEPVDLIVIFDDISLEEGQIRIRKKGSAGGHNGIKSIISCIGTQEFQRVKIGVGNKPEGWDLADFVLSRFGKKEREEVEQAMENACSAIEIMAEGQTDKAMNLYNAKK